MAANGIKFNEFPRDIQECIAFKLNVRDRTLLNSVMSKGKRFERTYDRSLGIIRKAIVNKKVTTFTVALRDFLNTLPQEETLREIKDILPEMFSAKVLENDRKDYIYTIVKTCDIETYKQLRADDFYKDVFENEFQLRSLLYNIGTRNHTLFEYIVINETFDMSVLEPEIPYMLLQRDTLKSILKYMNLSKEIVERMYIRSIDTMKLGAAELLDAHLAAMDA